MRPAEVDATLAQTLADGVLSRGERQTLATLAADPKVALALRQGAFRAARAALAARPGDATIVDWLEGVVKAVEFTPRTTQSSRAEAYFSPGEDCPRAIVGMLARATRSVDACVFTITDDRLSDALIDARRRGLVVRVISDNSKAFDLGSDIDRMQAAGIEVRVDHSQFHMHHKFAVADAAALLTGSYNWTRGASRDNEENFVVVDDPRLVARFLETFEHLWTKLA